MTGQPWKVVGGGDKGGIVVRTARETASPIDPVRLSTGAVVQELALEGDRLYYKRISGAGPDSGWVTLRLQSGKELLVKVDDAVGPAATPALRTADSGKMRILALHGKCSNSNVMKVQCSSLRKALGKDAEWLFLDGPILYHPEKESGLHYEPTEYEKLVSKDLPFYQWHNHRKPDSKYEFVDEGLAHIRKCLGEQGPFDVIVSFSMGSTMVSMLLLAMRNEGLEPPWRLSVFFNGGIPRDDRYKIHERFAHPLVKIHGGRTDPFWEGGEPSLSSIYTDVLELGHEDGHMFPRTQPRADEIFAQVVAEMRSRCDFV